jgi:NTE family protein
VLRPSVDLGRLAADFEARLPAALRFLTRGLGTRKLMTQDWLSMILFEPDYLGQMIEIGERDAEARLEELGAFLGVRAA